MTGRPGPVEWDPPLRRRAAYEGGTVGEMYSISGCRDDADALLLGHGVNPEDHPELRFELEQSIGEAMYDAFLAVLDDRLDDPVCAAILAELRPEEAHRGQPR
jgi:hypothetical protein